MGDFSFMEWAEKAVKYIVTKNVVIKTSSHLAIRGILTLVAEGKVNHRDVVIAYKGKEWKVNKDGTLPITVHPDVVGDAVTHIDDRYIRAVNACMAGEHAR